MNPHLSSPARRAVIVVLAFVVAILLSYFSIRNAFADHESEVQTLQGYERATRLEPNNFRCWYLLGRYRQYNFEDADTSLAIRAYTAALALNPRGAEIWSELATAYESEGDISEARDAYLRAKRAYPLSAEVSWRYGNFLLRQGELDSAFLEMRRAVEADPLRAGEALSRALRVEPNIDLVVDRLLPSSSVAYLNAALYQTADGHADNAFKLWTRLSSLHPRLLLPDAFPLVDALRRGKKFPEARQVWDQAASFAGLSNLPGPANSVLWDGGFESGVFGGGYAWLFPGAVRGVHLSIDGHEKHSGAHALQLLFDGTLNSSFAGPCHEVPVEPSTAYQFSVWVRTQSLTTDQGIRLQLQSLGAQDVSATTTADVRGTQPWTRLEIPWASGAGAHEMQVCVVRLASQEAQNNVEGIAWVDDVALVPNAAGSAKP